MKCQWFQFLIRHNIDDGQPLNGATRRHVDACPGCRSFYEAERTVARQLNARGEIHAEPSPFLKQRILNQIHAEAQPTPGSALRWIGAAAVASVALVLTLVFAGSAPESAPSVTAASSTKQEWVTATARVTSSEPLFRGVTNLNQPLHQELNLVLQDARAALDTLKEEFVPHMLLASSD